jgi:CHAD domain-containing protein/CYTH domain-containing protein
VALALLGEVTLSHARLEKPGDADALHDFRVALRRLRSWFRMLRADLEGSVPRRAERSLAKFAATSNAGRDAEVLLEWLAGAIGQLPPRHRSAARWMVRQQQSRRRESSRELQRQLHDAFDVTLQRLDRRLRRYRTTVYLDHGPRDATLAQKVAERMRKQATRLTALLANIQNVDDDAAIHRARIAGKRLRYLLEPLVDQHPALTELVTTLKRLQDTLGAVHDSHVWGEALHRTLQRAADQEGRALRRVASGTASKRRQSALPSRAGLMALAGAMHGHAATEFEVFRQEWMGEAALGFFSDLDRVANALADVLAPPLEIERKYLLTQLPPEMPRGTSTVLHQGYLPGEHIVERLRRATRGRRTSYARTIKFGAGLVRTEIEEPTTRAVFDALWPLTEGKRVEKRRHAVVDGALTWEVDVFTDRELVLAEVELTDERQEVSFPDWLAPYVERDVTEESTYVNYVLAK